MRRLRFVANEDVPEAARAALEVVGDGGVVLLPTETFYGLAADPSRGEAVDRVHLLKDRPAERALPVLCADWRQLESLVEVPEAYRVRLSRIWPGPLTAVLRCRLELAAAIGRTLAVRIPGHAMLRAVLYRTGPVTGTSANRHGTPPAVVPEAALDSLAGPPDLVLDGGATPGGVPSTVVDLTGDEPRIVRSGAFSWYEPYPWQQLP